MDTFEKEMARKQLEILKTINRNLNYIGRKLEMLNSTMEKNGIVMLPTEEITEEKLHMIDTAEQFLIEHGFFEERVRMHGNLARIEVPPADIPKLAAEEIREKIYDKFREIGFLFVTLDLKGYRLGSMNATLKNGKDK